MIEQQDRKSIKVVISRLELLAAILFASNDDSRFLLNGICLEICPDRKPKLIATDGRRLCVIESQAEQAQEFDSVLRLILRGDFIKPICGLSLAFGGKLFPWLQFESFPGSERLAVTFIGGNCYFEAEKNVLIQGEYPDWRKVVPEKNVERTQINDLGLNAAYVADFVRAGKILNAATTMIQMNLVGKESAIEVKLPGIEYFYALVMPCRVDETVNYQPEFLDLVKDFQKETAEASTNGEISSIANSADNESVERIKQGCDEDEELIQQCIEVIRSEQKASVSLLQRRLRIGYARAAKIMDELELRKIVGPSTGAEPREILIEMEAEKI